MHIRYFSRLDARTVHARQSLIHCIYLSVCVQVDTFLHPVGMLRIHVYSILHGSKGGSVRLCYFYFVQCSCLHESVPFLHRDYGFQGNGVPC